jgi:hypothetical protein
MVFLKKVALIFFRLVVILTVYFLVKFLTYKTFTVRRGVVVGSGYFKYSSGRRGYYHSYFPIVAFKGRQASETEQIIDAKTLSPFDEVGTPIDSIGSIYFTHPPPEWHLSEPTRNGDSMDYYYVNGDSKNARVLSLYSYWITESAIYWIIFAVFIWTVTADLYRLGKLEKARKSGMDNDKE